MLYRLTLSSPNQRFPVSVVMLPFRDNASARAFADEMMRQFAIAWPGDDVRRLLLVSVTRIEGAPRSKPDRDDDH